jgi:DinB superfamily
MTDTTTPPAQPAAIPPRLAPFLAQWDFMLEVLDDRLKHLTDEEYLWEPAPTAWSVREGPNGTTIPDAEVWAPIGDQMTPPRTIAWSVGHLGAGIAERADWLTGSHSKTAADYRWPRTAAEGIDAMHEGLSAWRDGLATMTDQDLDTVGRSAYPGGLDPELPLIEIVWWVNKELLFHAAEIWFMRDLYAARAKG